MRFWDREIAKEKFYAAKRPIKICDLPVYDDRYIKTDIINFRGLNLPEDDIECESFTAI